MAILRRKFREVFQEGPDGSLTPLLKLRVKNTIFTPQMTFAKGVGLGGIDFHSFRYLDVALDHEATTDIYEVKGFYPQE